MSLILVGLSHRTAPIELREQVDFSTRDVTRAVRELAARRATDEFVILSTCNRVEIYAVADAGAARPAIGRFVADYHGLPVDRLDPHLYLQLDAAATRHLFRVAGGLDSLVVGEPQILGQVKQAYQVAADAHATGPLLNRLFTCALAAGKRVRAETGIGEGAVSVSYAALSLARKIFGELTGLTALIVGAGDMAKLTATHLRSQHVGEIAVASRRLASAEALAGRVEGSAVPWSDIGRVLERADVVVTATGASEPVLTRDRVQVVMRTRRNRPLFIIDLGVPRDVEASAGELEQVFLYNVDDLQGIVSETLTRRTHQIDRADAIVADEVDKFIAWLRSRNAVPTVVALRQRFEDIRRAELKRLEPKLSGMTPEARARVDDVTRLIVEKLLLTPTEQLKSAPDQRTIEAWADALARLFALTGELEREEQEDSARVGPPTQCE